MNTLCSRTVFSTFAMFLSLLHFSLASMICHTPQRATNMPCLPRNVLDSLIFLIIYFCSFSTLRHFVSPSRSCTPRSTRVISVLFFHKVPLPPISVRLGSASLVTQDLIKKHPVVSPRLSNLRAVFSATRSASFNSTNPHRNDSTLDSHFDLSDPSIVSSWFDSRDERFCLHSPRHPGLF